MDQSVKAVELNKRQKQAELVEQLKRVHYTKYTNRWICFIDWNGQTNKAGWASQSAQSGWIRFSIWNSQTCDKGKTAQNGRTIFLFRLKWKKCTTGWTSLPC